MAAAVCACVVLVAPFFHRSVKAYHIVVSYTFVSSVAVPAVDVRSFHISSGRCGRAMNYNFFNMSHNTAKLYSAVPSFVPITTFGVLCLVYGGETAGGEQPVACAVGSDEHYRCGGE